MSDRITREYQMDTTCVVSVKVSVAWWLRPYLSGVAIMCRMTGLEPDWAKVSRVVMKAIRTEVAWHS